MGFWQLSIIKAAGNVLCDMVFPRFCFSCESEGEWLCLSCVNNIKRKNLEQCPWCGVDSSSGVVCDVCGGQAILKRLVAVYEYDDRSVEKLIHAMKYRGAYDIARRMGEIMAEKGRSYICSDSINSLVVVPIPLNINRYRERGFNQSEIIAHTVSRRWGIACNTSSLIRIKNTEHQARLTPEERSVNIVGSFLVQGDLLRGRDIVLIDDVCTTGATLREAGEALKGAGVNSVSALVFARGYFDYGMRLTDGR